MRSRDDWGRIENRTDQPKLKRGHCGWILIKGVAFPQQKRKMWRQLDNLSISRLGKSSVESVFSDDLKPDGRERSEEEVGIYGKKVESS